MCGNNNKSNNNHVEKKVFFRELDTPLPRASLTRGIFLDLSYSAQILLCTAVNQSARKWLEDVTDFF